MKKQQGGYVSVTIALRDRQEEENKLQGKEAQNVEHMFFGKTAL